MVDEYHPFKDSELITAREELSQLREQNALLSREFGEAMQYIQGLDEALTAFFAGIPDEVPASALDGAGRNLYDTWKLTTRRYPRNPDVIALLWDAHDNLHARFNLSRPRPFTALALWGEKAQEFRDAATADVGTEDYTTNLVNEAADLVTVMLALIGSLNIERERFYEACRAVAAKNDAKTTATHYLNEETGKITRKG